jgi:uncharacterized protein YaiE (UPF0345 family)
MGRRCRVRGTEVRVALLGLLRSDTFENVTTLGIMMPGEYEFGTGSPELMEILDGEPEVLLPGQTEWQTFTAGESFEVPADSSFKLRLTGLVDYCCSYG